MLPLADSVFCSLLFLLGMVMAIMCLADQGFSIATIAHRVGLSLSDVESILKNRADA